MLVDLSHVVEHGMITYKGLPAPLICDFLSREQARSLYAPGTEFQIGRIDLVANTGTYVDSPFQASIFEEKDKEFLQAIADLAAIAIDNARQYERSEFLRQSPGKGAKLPSATANADP